MIDELLKNKELGLYDWGKITKVYPTGRYIDTEQYQNPEYYQPRDRFMVEIKELKWFGSTRWVSSNNLKKIKTYVPKA